MLVTTRIFCERNPGVGLSWLRKLISRAKDNGLEAILIRTPSVMPGRARKIVFHEEDMLRWLRERGKK